MRDKPFALIGINSDPDLRKIRQIVKDKKLTWRSFWNGPEGTNGPISSLWNVQGWPTVYVLDHKGVIRFRQVTGKRLDAAVETLLAEIKNEKK